MYPSYWALLGFVVWTWLLLVGGIGVPRVRAVVSGQARANSFNPAVPHGSESYQRRMRAHLNCVENLPLFGALVLLGGALNVEGALFQIAAVAVLPARVGQSLSHIASGRNRAVLARFAFFSVQLTCYALMSAALVLRGLELPSR
jgi:uncharacterized membrane protein YecN with MAPEG domain